MASKHRNNKTWRDREDQMLRKRTKAGMSAEEMGKAHNRTKKAVEEHLKVLDLKKEYNWIQDWLDEEVTDEQFFSFMLQSEQFRVTDFSDRNAMEALLSDQNSVVPDWVYRVLVVNTIGIGLVLIAVIALMVAGV